MIEYIENRREEVKKRHHFAGTNTYLLVGRTRGTYEFPTLTAMVATDEDPELLVAPLALPVTVSGERRPRTHEQQRTREHANTRTREHEHTRERAEETRRGNINAENV
jgi:hypothetical protein